MSRGAQHLRRPSCKAVIQHPSGIMTKRTLTQTACASRYLSTAPNLSVDLNGRENLTLPLPDGRTLGYAEYGQPDGFPVFIFHGFPSSRLEAYPVDKLAHRRRLRIIAPDRPGYGLSTPQPGRRIIDWPADVLAFARHARLNRFAVLGLSGGGPYAVACAHMLPREMVSAVGAFASGPPWEAGAHHMHWTARATCWMATSLPAVFGAGTNALVGLLRWAVGTRPMIGWIDKAVEAMDKKDREQQQQKAPEEELGLQGEEEPPPIAEQRERLLRLMFEGFRQGPDAFVHEARLLSAQGWGFKLEDVDYDLIRMWHGSNDANAPIEMIRYMAKRLPHAVLYEFEGDTHYTVGNHLGRAFSELVSDEEVKKHYGEA